MRTLHHHRARAVPWLMLQMGQTGRGEGALSIKTGFAIKSRHGRTPKFINVGALLINVCSYGLCMAIGTVRYRIGLCK